MGGGVPAGIVVVAVMASGPVCGNRVLQPCERQS